MNQGTNLGSQKGRWIILAALVAVLGALLFLLPGGILQAQQTAETYYHEENNGEPVVTLTADDPEGVTPIYWDILEADIVADLPGGGADDIDGDDIADFASFSVADGVLSFNSPPNFETPTDAGPDNNYKVVVQASDGGLTEWVQYFKVTVNVLDVEEQGTVAWTIDPDGAGTAGTEGDNQTLLEFQAGAILSAEVTDPDNLATDPNTTWKWYRSQNNTGPWTQITNEDGVPVTTFTYTASDSADNNDVGMYLRAVADYADNRGGNKTAELVSPYTVQATRVENNSVPEFAPTAVERDVQEGLASANVGAPVTATDADNHVLNYSLEEANDRRVHNRPGDGPDNDRPRTGLRERRWDNDLHRYRQGDGLRRRQYRRDRRRRSSCRRDRDHHPSERERGPRVRYREPDDDPPGRTSQA